MKVKQSSFFNEALRFIKYGSQLGWHERNAGNISLRLLRSEVESISDDLVHTMEWKSLPVTITDMAGEYVFTTVSGTYFIDMDHMPEGKFCICEVSSSGDSYRVVWGGSKPTSELCGHLLSLAVLKGLGARRAVYHAHPQNIVALSYILSPDDKTFSEAIWESETECAFVLPDGLGVLGFYVPGTLELAIATADKLKQYSAVLWSFHGIFATGSSIASAFGLAHAVEKAAEIKLKVLSSGLPILNTISKKEQEITANTYGMKLKRFE